MKRSVIGVALCSLLGHASADPATATKLADEGNALVKAGKFSEAAERYRDAWRNDKLRPEFLCNVGISYYKAKDLVRAHLLLGQCLEQSSLDPKLAENVRKVQTASENVLRAGGHTPVRIVIEPSATSISILELGDDEAFVGSRVVWLPFGTYHVRAHAEGYVDQTQTVAPTTVDAVTLTLTLDHVKVEDKPIVVERPIQPPPPLPPSAPAPERPSNVLPIATTVVTVAAIGLAIYARGEAGTRADRAATAIDPTTFADDKSAVDTWNTTFVVGTGVAVVGAVASVLLWHRALSAPEVEVHASANGISLGYTARF
ncbi:MAG TPA: hypothetical protein VF403_10950 [Kofleriaceae bacterium]